MLLAVAVVCQISDHVECRQGSHDSAYGTITQHLLTMMTTDAVMLGQLMRGPATTQLSMTVAHDIVVHEQRSTHRRTITSIVTPSCMFWLVNSCSTLRMLEGTLPNDTVRAKAELKE